MVQEKLLTVNKLRTEFFQNKKTSVTAINEISFDIGKGEILGLVGRIPWRKERYLPFVSVF